MKKLFLLAGVMLSLAGCAATADTNAGQPSRKERLADSSTPTGTLIPRKAPSRTDNLTIVDKQALENDRTNGSGTNNWAAGKP